MIRGMLKSAALGLVVLMAGSALAETKLPSFSIEGIGTNQTLSGEKLREALGIQQAIKSYKFTSLL